MTTTHNYSGRHRRWGHDYAVIDVSDDGSEARFVGWGRGIKDGDYIVIDRDRTSTTRYQVKSIKYKSDPRDCWDAKVVFAPRTVEQGEQA